jgi:hypothetical protein
MAPQKVRSSALQVKTTVIAGPFRGFSPLLIVELKVAVSAQNPKLFYGETGEYPEDMNN